MQGLNTQFWQQSFTAMGILRQDGIPTDFNTFHGFKPNAGNTEILLGNGTVAFNDLRFFLRSSNGQVASVNAGVILGAGWKIVCWQWNWTTRTCKLFMDGNTFTNQNLLMDDFDFRIPTSSYTVGTRQTNLGALIQPMQLGRLGEFLYYNDVKSNADINTLGNYFATRFGLTWINV